MRDFAIVLGLLVALCLSEWHLRRRHIARVRSERSQNVFVGVDTAQPHHVVLWTQEPKGETKVWQVKQGQDIHDDVQRAFEAQNEDGER